MLMFSPSERASSIAGTPSSVPGILIIRFGRSTRRQNSRACSSVASVSWARAGSTSSDTKPSPPCCSSQTRRSTSHAERTSVIAISRVISVASSPCSASSVIWSSYSFEPRMAFSKMAGFEVTPRRQSSSIRRPSSPHSISPRRIWSSHTLVPAAVRAASRSLTAVTPIASSLSSPCLEPLDQRLPALDDALRGQAEVLVDVLVRPGRAERGHADHLAVLADPSLPAERRRGLDRDSGPARRGQHPVAVVGLLLAEALEAGHRDDPGGDPDCLELVGRGGADVELRAGADQDQVGLRILLGLPQHVRPALDRVVRDRGRAPARDPLPR